MTNPSFLMMYHPALNNVQVSVSPSSVDDHFARGWLLVDPGVTPPAPSTPYTTVAQVASQLSSGTGPIGLAGRAAFGSVVDLDGDLLPGHRLIAVEDAHGDIDDLYIETVA